MVVKVNKPLVHTVTTLVQTTSICPFAKQNNVLACFSKNLLPFE